MRKLETFVIDVANVHSCSMICTVSFFGSIKGKGLAIVQRKDLVSRANPFLGPLFSFFSFSSEPHDTERHQMDISEAKNRPHPPSFFPPVSLKHP